MMDDILLLQTIERYLDGKMSAEEKSFFEQHRKNVPEIDQMVVEHSMFLHQMEDYAANRNIKHSLQQVHTKLVSTGQINEGTELTTKAKVVKMWNKYKKVTAIAAVVGGSIALFISATVAYFTPTNASNVEDLRGKVASIEIKQRNQDAKITEVESKIPKGFSFLANGTGFLVDTKGYIVTNAHVLKGSSFATVVNSKNEEFKAKIVYSNVAKDLAILKIDDKDFKEYTTLPYALKRNGADLGEEIFTLGFPRNDIVVGVGYLSSRTGFNGDTLTCQLQLNANPGNSGGPVFNKNGEIIGILSSRQTQADGIGFAIKSKHIYQLVDDYKKNDTASYKIKLPNYSAIKGEQRTKQIEAVENCIFLVKAYNK